MTLFKKIALGFMGGMAVLGLVLGGGVASAQTVPTWSTTTTEDTVDAFFGTFQSMFGYAIQTVGPVLIIVGFILLILGVLLYLVHRSRRA